MNTFTECVIKYGYQEMIDFIVSLVVLEKFRNEQKYNTRDERNIMKNNIIAYIAYNTSQYEKNLCMEVHDDKEMLEPFNNELYPETKIWEIISPPKINSLSIYISDKYGPEKYDDLIEQTRSIYWDSIGNKILKTNNINFMFDSVKACIKRFKGYKFHYYFGEICNKFNTLQLIKLIPCSMKRSWYLTIIPKIKKPIEKIKNGKFYMKRFISNVTSICRKIGGENISKLLMMIMYNGWFDLVLYLRNHYVGKMDSRIMIILYSINIVNHKYDTDIINSLNENGILKFHDDTNGCWKNIVTLKKYTKRVYNDNIADNIDVNQRYNCKAFHYSISSGIKHLNIDIGCYVSDFNNIYFLYHYHRKQVFDLTDSEKCEKSIYLSLYKLICKSYSIFTPKNSTKLILYYF